MSLRRLVNVVVFGTVGVGGGTAWAAPGEVLSEQKISDTEGGFGGTLSNIDIFGVSLARLGDVDGNGIPEIAVGSFDDDGGMNRGAVWVLFLNTDGTVSGHQKISDTEGGFPVPLENQDRLGVAVSGLGDLDGDGVPDLVAGAGGDDDGGTARGALWVLFLNSDGTVKTHQKISDTEGGFTGGLHDGTGFGFAVTALGDVDGDGVIDLAVGSPGDGDKGPGTPIGAAWILFLNADGTVKGQQKINDTEGNFTGVLDDGDGLGTSLSGIGDLDGDGVPDVAVGAIGDDDGGPARGAVWILFLNANGTVKAHQKISDTEGNFTGFLEDVDRMGMSVTTMGDVDGDDVTDLAVGAHLDDDGGVDRGAVWVMLLNTDGTVKAHQKISDTEGSFTGVLENTDLFGRSLVRLGDLDGDGRADLAVGAMGDNDGGSARGAVWIVFQDGSPICPFNCGSDDDGAVGILDFFEVFRQWGELGGSCDFFGTGVGRTEMLQLFDDWGMCP